jgi:CHAT domain-containing protein
VMDRAVSSYTTSIRALVKARRDALAPPSKALLVSAANTPACRSLRHATDEIKEVGVLLASKDISSIPLQDAQAGKQKVLGHLAACQIFHYAGHGLEHPSDPLRSALLLHDWKADMMMVSDVLDLHLAQARPFLAYLSACETGQASNQRLQDESIHLVGAYQLAGFRHVVGTLWSVYDWASVEMATMTYQNLLRGALTDDSVPRGLHRAAWELRRLGFEGGSDADERKMKVCDSEDELDAGGWEDERDRKSRSWVPFAHFGV